MGILEVASVIEKLESKVIGAVRLRFKVPMAEHGANIESPIAALATSGREIKAAMVAGSLFSRCTLHFLSFKGGYPPRVFFDERVRKLLKTNGRACERWPRVWKFLKRLDLEGWG